VPALATKYDPRDGVPSSRPQRPEDFFRSFSIRESRQAQKVEVDIVSVNIKPLEDRLVVKPLEAEQTTASGLVIPDTAKEKPQEGEVVAVGPGRFDENGNRVPLDVKVGDKVIYSKYGGTEVKYGGEEYLILSARDVLAVVS
jgi:chaperonin GroES